MKIFFLLILLFNIIFAFDYNLKPIKLKENSYYLYGKEEYFSQENGGDISNSAFIITKNSVIIIDTGSTYNYAVQLKNIISKITKNKTYYIINTHHHPDHFLGNYAFENSDIFATKYTLEEIKNNGELYVSNMANLLKEVAYDTKVKAPNKILEKNKLVLDDYELELIFLKGHTQDDLVIFDKQTKILYAADLIFNKRTLATPHANIKEWISALEKLKEIDFNILVPGHGKISYSKKVIDENIDYLNFLEKRLNDSISEGLDTFEILNLTTPQKFKNNPMFKEEYERSIINLYPKYEKK